MLNSIETTNSRALGGAYPENFPQRPPGQVVPNPPPSRNRVRKIQPPPKGGIEGRKSHRPPGAACPAARHRRRMAAEPAPGATKEKEKGSQWLTSLPPDTPVTATLNFSERILSSLLPHSSRHYRLGLEARQFRDGTMRHAAHSRKRR